MEKTNHISNRGSLDKKDSLLYFLANEASSGSIANKVPYSDYKTIDEIRFTAIQILNRDGDRQYSMKSFSDVIQDALLEYEENKYEGKYAEGGSFEGTSNMNVLQYFAGLNMSALPDNAAKYIQDQILTDSNINLLTTDDEDFIDVKNAISESYPNAIPKQKSEEMKSESSEIMEWKEAIETLNMLIEDGGSKKDIAEWTEAVETLNILISE